MFHNQMNRTIGLQLKNTTEQPLTETHTDTLTQTHTLQTHTKIHTLISDILNFRQKMSLNMLLAVLIFFS